MSTTAKFKKRGFVMTGGGAKGFYEAGVIHAFHLTGIEFDVITGSSIGAMNSIFFAEYLLHKNQLAEEVRSDPEKTIEALDPQVKAFHHAWLTLPEVRIIDDSPQGALGKLKDDLLQFNLSLPQLIRLIWWWTDPKRGALTNPGLWPTLTKMGSELVERLGGIDEVLRIIKNHHQEPVLEAMRTFLARFGMEHSLIPPEDDRKLRDVFTQPISPLRLEHLVGEVSAPDIPGVQKYRLVDPVRTLRDYVVQGIEVRLTRANYRTGRLEISSYVTPLNFVRFLQKQAWRLQKNDPEKIPLGSFRLQVPGNPNAINAALCSGRFPGVFSPFPIDDIYPADDIENNLLYHLLRDWLKDPQVATSLAEAYQGSQAGNVMNQEEWERIVASWRDSKTIRNFFPKENDTYVDGGGIDNTPSNSAMDFVREWANQTGHSKREVILELFVIFLSVEPMLKGEGGKAPNLYEQATRSINIISTAKLTNDTNIVSTINTFGQRGEDLGEALKLVLESYQEELKSLDPTRLHQIEERLRTKASQRQRRGYLGEDAAGILERMAQWAEEKVAQDLPLHVEEIKIYPDEMPLDTLQFTERLGYRKANAIKMLTMGCYNTLWTLRVRLEGQKAAELDANDQQALQLTRKWMGITEWPEVADEQEVTRQSWYCLRTSCVYHAQHCPHGAHEPEAY